jgi:glucose-6-phosphate 1-dehydrogenase
MIDRLVVLGAMGDLMGRYLAPALVELHEAGELPDGFEVVGAARAELDDTDLRRHIGEQLEEHATDHTEEARKAVLDMLRYAEVDATEPDDLAAVIDAESGPAVVYLALPPAVFGPAMRALSEAGFSEGSQLVVEKPFGDDLESARELNHIAHTCLAEEAIFRIDHFLGMQTVQNVLGLRFANRLLEPVWNCHHIDGIEIVWDETLTLEGRGFYDDVGALADMVQNHLLQLLCLVAMEPPSSLEARELRDRKVQLLREVRRPDREAVATDTVRARYTAGHIDGRDVPAYVEEEGVDPANGTETFTEVRLAIDNWRWAGVPLVLRTGKALGRDRKEVVVRFRPVPHHTFGAADHVPNELRIGLDPETLSLDLNINSAGEQFDLERTHLDRELARGHVSAYGRVLLAALRGDPTLSIRDDEIEESWAIVDPIREAWAAGAAPLDEYTAGSSGPEGSLLR